MSSRRTSRILALLPFGAVLLLAQDPGMGPPAIPTFRSSTRMVLVDVVATDSNGKRAAGQILIHSSLGLLPDRYV